MCFWGNKKSEDTSVPAVAAVTAVDTAASDNAEAEATANRAKRQQSRKAALASGTTSTLLTGAQGLTDEANTKKATLLGQTA